MLDEYPISAKNSPSSTTLPRRESQADEFSIHQTSFDNPRIVSGTHQDDPKQETKWRSPSFSEFSLKDAKNAFQSSTEDLLLPKPHTLGNEQNRYSSPWHSAPLAFAFLPALAGLLFTNGSGTVTDIMLLGLASIFLNWSVRLPWDWYHAAQAVRKVSDENCDTDFLRDRDDESNSPDDMPEEEKEILIDPKPRRPLSRQEAAANELRRYELLALLSCFTLPLFGAYLLHTLRSQLHKRSEGLVSNYNLTIFLLASELRPFSHVIKLVKARTLHLQRIVASKPCDGDLTLVLAKDISQRLENLEARCVRNEKAGTGLKVSDKPSSIIISEARKTLQPDLDALNRAVRRYEKRATLQAFQTESRLQELENRLKDAISLAAAAANNEHRRRHESTATLIEWTATTVILPLRALGIVISLPLSLMTVPFQLGKSVISRPEELVGKGRRPLNSKLSSKIAANRSLERR